MSNTPTPETPIVTEHFGRPVTPRPAIVEQPVEPVSRYAGRTYAQSLTTDGLAERLRKVADSPRRWPIEDRGILLYEAARRLELFAAEATQ